MNPIFTHAFLMGLISFGISILRPEAAEWILPQVLFPAIVALPLAIHADSNPFTRLRISGLAAILISLSQSGLSLIDLPISWLAACLLIPAAKVDLQSKSDGLSRKTAASFSVLTVWLGCCHLSPLGAELSTPLVHIFCHSMIVAILPIVGHSVFSIPKLHQSCITVCAALILTSGAQSMPMHSALSPVAIYLAGLWLASLPLIFESTEAGHRMAPALITGLCLMALMGFSSAQGMPQHWIAAMASSLIGFTIIFTISPKSDLSEFADWVGQRP